MSKSLLIVTMNDRFFLSHFLDRARKAQERGYDVCVLTPDSGSGERIKAMGFRFRGIVLDRHNVNPLPEMRTLQQLVRIYREEHPDLIWQIGIKPIVLGSLAARLGAPAAAVINAPVGLGYVFAGEGWKARLIRPLIRIALRNLLDPPLGRIIFENNEDLQELQGLGAVRKQDAVVIHGAGVDIEAFRITEEPAGKDLHVLFAARMIEEKGVRIFVEAARHLREKGYPNFRFYLAGGVDHEHSSAIPEEHLHSWQESGVVEWLGHRTDIAELMARCHIFCLPTWHREGVPKVLLEAMASQRAVITTDVVGCREVIQHRRNGWLIPPKDAEALAGAILALASQPALRRKIARRARQDAERKYSTEIVSRRTLQIFEQLQREIFHSPSGQSPKRVSNPRGQPKTLCVIPSHNGKDELRRLLDSLRTQEFRHDTLVIDSSSSDGTAQLLAEYPAVKTQSIPQEEFGHGKTRQMAFATHPGYDVLVYLTQDAEFCEPESLGALVSLLDDPRIGAACGRQIPHRNATVFARFSRFFNYPALHQMRCLPDKKQWGIKTPFLSDSCTAYRARALADVGGFPLDVAVSEDLYVGAKMLQSGWCLVQSAEPIVRHSHNYTLRQEMGRYTLIGSFHAREQWIKAEFGGAGGEGLRYALTELRYLGMRRLYLWPYSLLRNAMKLAAFQWGYRMVR